MVIPPTSGFHPIIPPAASVLSQNTLFVDATYGDNATAMVDDPALPWATIQAAMTASAASDKISIALGSYAESLIIPHDLFIAGLGVTGLTAAPDISSGNLFGRLGHIEHHANGSIIYPESTDQDNWDALVSAVTTGATQSELYAISLFPGVYGLLSSNNTIDFSVAGFDVIDIGGIGTMPLIQSDPTAGIVFNNVTSNSFNNLEINTLGTDNAINARTSAVVDISGSWTNIKSNGRLVPQGSLSTFTGLIDTVECSGSGIGGSMTWTGQILNVNNTGSDEWRVGKIGPDSICQVINGPMQVNEDYAGRILIGNDTILTITTTALRIGEGKIICQNGGGATTSSDYQLVIDNPDTTNLVGGGSTAVLRDDSVITNIRANTVCDNSSVLRDGARFDGGHVGDGATSSDLGCQVKAEFNHVTFESSDTDHGFVASDGAKFNSCTFLGKTASADNEFRPNIIGRSVVSVEGQNADDIFWDDSESAIAMPLTGQPSEQDPGGPGKRLIPDLTLFQMFVRRMPTAGTGGTLGALVGEFFEFQLFQDNADVFAFGAGTWTYRTTATDATRIDNLLGNPGADVTDTGTTQDAVISERASIIVNDATYEGVPFGEEITVSPVNFGRVHVSANSVAFTVPPQANIVTVDDDVIVGSRGAIASLASTGSTGGTRPARAGRDPRPSIASGGSIASVGSAATVASLPSIASTGSIPSIGAVVSQPSISAVASAGSVASVAADAGSAAAKITITLRENQQDLDNVQRIGTIAPYVDIVGPNGEPVSGKDRLVLRGQFDGHGIFEHVVDFGATKEYFKT